MNDLYEICPFYIYESNICAPLIKYDYKMHGCAQISRYEIFSLFVVIKYTRRSKNKILDYTRVTHAIHCVQYKYNDKKVIIHMIIIT